MERQRLTRLKKVMRVQSNSGKCDRMQRFVMKELDAMDIDYSKDKIGNIYATKGNADMYPTMVCHMDTVHNINDHAVVFQHQDVLFAIDTKSYERYGIGGDDKVGVFVTLEMLLKFDNFKAVFFVDEEIGCIGSSACDFTFFEDSTFVLQCDRRGKSDFVTTISGTKLSNDELHNHIDDLLKKYDRKLTSGGMTDVEQIAEKTDVQVANMSCGYYDPHSDNEYIKISEVFATADFCYEVLSKTDNQLWRMPNEDRFAYTYGNRFGGYNYFHDDWYDEDETTYYHRYNPETNQMDKVCAYTNQLLSVEEIENLNEDEEDKELTAMHSCQCKHKNLEWFKDEKVFYCMDCYQTFDENKNIIQDYGY